MDFQDSLGSGLPHLVLLMLGGIAYGLILIGMGQMFQALREIALNTRATAAAAGGRAMESTRYVGLGFISGVMRFLGLLLIGLCVLVTVMTLMK